MVAIARSFDYILGIMESTPSTPADPLRRRPLRRIIRNWKQRHRLPFNFWIHMIGIPLAVAGVVLLFVPGWEWYWGVGGLVLGYFLQWLGHLAEGNDVGEWAAVKRLLGLPYVGIAPRWEEGQVVKSAP